MFTIDLPRIWAHASNEILATAYRQVEHNHYIGITCACVVRSTIDSIPPPLIGLLYDLPDSTY